MVNISKTVWVTTYTCTCTCTCICIYMSLSKTITWVCIQSRIFSFTVFSSSLLIEGTSGSSFSLLVSITTDWDRAAGEGTCDEVVPDDEITNEGMCITGIERRGCWEGGIGGVTVVSSLRDLENDFLNCLLLLRNISANLSRKENNYDKIYMYMYMYMQSTCTVSFYTYSTCVYM